MVELDRLCSWALSMSPAGTILVVDVGGGWSLDDSRMTERLAKRLVRSVQACAERENRLLTGRGCWEADEVLCLENVAAIGYLWVTGCVRKGVHGCLCEQAAGNVAQRNVIP
jgi:hypothetical protein